MLDSVDGAVNAQPAWRMRIGVAAMRGESTPAASHFRSLIARATPRLQLA